MERSLVIRSVQFAYKKERTFKFPDITCKKGEHYLITGSSGCGKTTLLHLIAGLIKPETGEIAVSGKDITQLGNKELDQYRGKEIGIVFQKPHFIKSLTAQENLEMAAFLNHLPLDRLHLEYLFDSLHIAGCRNSKTNQMSQGELQRLSIARAVVNKPSLILADEPTSSLDDKNCEESLRLLQQQAEALKASLIIVTHDNRLISKFSNIVRLES
ncbi:ATP-binding cassette domain-containing protein [Parabacteroides sp. PF5-9]|uniref:ABC transporter ATP-binding protein n=1 Tax=Parabacteroides sp. PF5-9 TaxID=1742404 RepID=UPI002475AF50|nr:ATP-binding cassette domain-containing protein [Parabacteroides sp. PF5-9]MDH6357289.1 ABC-type lipoprotein export system ATPase subunit [Parabacteroides sp. PF5-9]